MRSGIAQIEKAIKMWHVETGEQPRGGWSSSVVVGATNCSNGSGGWLASTMYTCAFEDALRVTGHLPPNFVRNLPNNTLYSSATNGTTAVMLYPCGSNRYGLFFHLRQPTAQDASDVAAAEAAGCQTAPRTTYGMRGVRLITP